MDPDGTKHPRSGTKTSKIIRKCWVSDAKLEYRGIPASIVISENLPRHTRISAEAGQGKGVELTPGGRDWEANAGELGAGSSKLGGRRDPHV